MPHSRYFTQHEVSVHNTVGDAWVSYLGKVYDLTPLLEEFKGKRFSCHRLLYLICNANITEII